MNAELLRNVAAVYDGSDGDATKQLYARLEALGIAGFVAMNLFRACKASQRAKLYRRRQKGSAYGKKQWSMDNLCTALTNRGSAAGIDRWGWGRDDKAVGYEHVLYVELPTGQVSFHTDRRGVGPDYPGVWDGCKASGGRIVQWCARLLDEHEAEAA